MAIYKWGIHCSKLLLPINNRFGSTLFFFFYVTKFSYSLSMNRLHQHTWTVMRPVELKPAGNICLKHFLMLSVSSLTLNPQISSKFPVLWVKTVLSLETTGRTLRFGGCCKRIKNCMLSVWPELDDLDSMSLDLTVEQLEMISLSFLM